MEGSGHVVNTEEEEPADRLEERLEVFRCRWVDSGCFSKVGDSSSWREDKGSHTGSARVSEPYVLWLELSKRCLGKSVIETASSMVPVRRPSHTQSMPQTITRPHTLK